MGIQDRDYYHEKRYDENRGGIRKPTTSHLANLSWKTFIRAILIWIVLALIFLAILHYHKPLQQNHFQAAKNVPAAIAMLRNCESLPPHGSSYVIDPSVMKRTDVLYSGLEIQNKHNHPMVAILSDSSGSTRFFAVSISSGNTAQVSVPAGQYGMQVLVGSDWCNLETGFSDGANISVAGGISINAGLTTVMQFSGSGLRPVQLALAYSTSRPVDHQNITQPSEVMGVGKLDLVQTRDGHYYSSGTVNGSPVVFMIDTGATTVSISSEIASRAGIEKCSPQLVVTANGKVNACKTTVPEVTFGKFKLTHVEVTIMPNMPGNALLGMNILRNFHIEQIDKVMRISSR